MPECHSKCVDTCYFTSTRECGRPKKITSTQQNIADGYYLTMVSDVEFTDGTLGPCYALVGENGSACAVTIRRAIELQSQGYPFTVPHPVYPNDFSTFFDPDFPSIGGNTLKAFVERTPEALG